MIKYTLFTLMLLVATHAYATPYTVVADQSEITFSGTHAGNEFEGVFGEWDAEIDFDKNDLKNSKAVVNFDMRNAVTDNKMYDGTLPTPDWFDVRNYPQAMFETTSITKTDEGFEAEGDLTIRGITNTVAFDFNLEGQNPVVMTAEFPINRLDYEIGLQSDPNAEWVSEEMIINITLTAQSVK